ncbi:79_t:CDS:2 [Ambispora gerdemannii]|uniref:79_t:CDS:1 n=1 Tax=Ambispora gerdemannii TaxID=144530 RepID=A0A9N9AL11_9GLOM|nr:79_t:CDS:2 [Ambispora gerdemannii]
MNGTIENSATIPTSSHNIYSIETAKREFLNFPKPTLDTEDDNSPFLKQCWDNFKRFLGFVGPGYLIAVGYFDPGNWATDLQGGSQFGYSLLFVVLISNFMAMLLQSLAIKLGIVTGMDLAQACRYAFPRWGNYILYVLCELAIIACDLAEVIGSAIALNLLFKIPLPWGVTITACDVMIVLLIYKDNSMKAARILEGLVMFLVAAVGICFVSELIYSKPDSTMVLKGYLPSSGIFTDSEQLYIAIGIIGATVMPHNLYLHSHLVKVRKYRDQAKLTEEWHEALEAGNVKRSSSKRLLQECVRRVMKLSICDSTIALAFALFVNSSILIVAAANFYYTSNDVEVADLFDAYDLLCKYLGQVAGFLFGLALLIAGQSSTLTGTMAGQVVMEGFLGLKLRPWLRRLVTRGLAIIPALTIAIIKGGSGLNSMLVASQVALSLQLPFAVIPLVYFTSSKKIMKIDSQTFYQKNDNVTETEKSSSPDNEKNNPSSLDNDKNNPSSLDNDNSNPIITPSTNIETASSILSEQSQFIDFSNPLWLIITASVVSFIIVGLDLYLVFSTVRDIIRGD